MRNVYFVRHGETVWNVENKICGATESALTEQGREQARAIGREIKARIEAGELRIDRMLCSPLSRARDTAQEIADILKLPLAVEPRLREQNFGIWEGTARDGEGFQRAKENFIDSFGTGESMLRLAQRMPTIPICWSHITASPAWWSHISGIWTMRNLRPSEYGMPRSEVIPFRKRRQESERGMCLTISE